MPIAAVGQALPANYYDQEALLAALKRVWPARPAGTKRLESFHKNVRVSGRHLALPMDAYDSIRSFTDANRAFVDCAVDLGERCSRDTLECTWIPTW